MAEADGAGQGRWRAHKYDIPVAWFAKKAGSEVEAAYDIIYDCEDVEEAKRVRAMPIEAYYIMNCQSTNASEDQYGAGEKNDSCRTIFKAVESSEECLLGIWQMALLGREQGQELPCERRHHPQIIVHLIQIADIDLVIDLHPA